MSKQSNADSRMTWSLTRPWSRRADCRPCCASGESHELRRAGTPRTPPLDPPGDADTRVADRDLDQPVLRFTACIAGLAETVTAPKLNRVITRQAAIPESLSNSSANEIAGQFKRILLHRCRSST